MVNAEWKTSSLDKLAKVYRGGSPRPIQNYLTSSPDGINWIKIGDVKVGEKYITSTEEKIIPEGVSRSRRVNAGDFILSNSMSFGRPYILKLDGCIHDGWLTIQDYQETFDKDFLYYLLSSDDVMKQYISMAAGSSVKNLNKEKVSSLVVTYPQKDEQYAIATALSDMDTLIADLEKLIAKKKAIKQGAMQDLLTGKKRLPGFSGEWKNTNLEEISDLITDGSHESPIEVPNGYYMPSVKDMTNVGFDFSDCKQISYTDYLKLVRNGCRPQAGDMLIAKDGSILKHTFVQDIELPIVILSSIAIIRLKPNVMDAHFLAQYFSQPMFIEKTAEDYKTGTGVPRIVLKNFKRIPLFLPVNIEEQKALASVFDDMDNEIISLQTKLEKYRCLKQGMMDKLLTGEIRLV